MTDEAPGIRSYELVAQGGGPLPAFTAGAHIDVMISAGPTCQCSLYNKPSEHHRYLIAVLRNPAGLSERRNAKRVVDDAHRHARLHVFGEPCRAMALAHSTGTVWRGNM
jgi:vanillate O-demethylase ferredoxin subunit